MNAIVPIPQVDVRVRDATLADVAFIDRLQKLHGKQVGFMRTSWIENKIKAGQVNVAVDSSGEPLGYCMGVDRYFKRDDVGIIHQLNVVPTKQRGFVGATLLRAMFERAAYGCRLFCCWCAQDIEANHFWESMGFVPLAYRAGSEKKRRVHIFWQKRIRQDDWETPWWFPSQTTGGAINEDRLVLPIPPGKQWSDEMPVIVLPGDREKPKQIEGPKPKVARKPAQKDRPAIRTLGGPRVIGVSPAPVVATIEKKPREKAPKRKNDPKLVSAARELRDRWLEQVNSGAGMALFESAGKYDVARALPAMNATPLLPAA
jgi:N-acetylglutamate synthase-like GNAT family acetyltransferase